MKIAIVGATGNVGSRLTAEALRRGHSVTAIARQASSLPKRNGVTARDLDINDSAALVEALKGHDVAVSTVRFQSTTPENTISAVKRAGVPRFLVVGGAGSLEVAPGVQLIDTPEFPAAYKAEAGAGRDFLNALRKEKELDWTFVSPSALFVPGERTGHFRLGKDNLLTAADGKSRISMEDYAIAFLDEVERPAHPRQRFTVGY